MARTSPQDRSGPAFRPTALWLLPLLCLLSACGGGTTRLSYTPGSRIYPEPGPREDPWRPYIRQAATRFSVPQRWIRAVMQQESGGHEYRNGQPIISGAGAMGLMQLMPATYADLQSQYGLGPDPYEPHDNIMAGTGYIRQMYQKYGAPAFLAAYNAGPQRLDDYLASGRRLPNETVNYVASIAPSLGTEIAMTGPLATYAGGGRAYASARYVAPVRLASYRARRRRHGGVCWHDPDAAYDPDAPCQAPPAQQPVQPAVAYAMAAPVMPPLADAPGCWRDPDAAYDSPCGTRPPAPPAPVPPALVAMAPVAAAPVTVAAVPEPMQTQARARLAAYAPAPAYGGWAVQVGAFNSMAQARFATTMARQAAFRELSGSQSLVQQTSPFGGAVLYRARLAGLARPGAAAACSSLRAQSIACIMVAPGG